MIDDRGRGLHNPTPSCFLIPPDYSIHFMSHLPHLSPRNRIQLGRRKKRVQADIQTESRPLILRVGRPARSCSTQRTPRLTLGWRKLHDGSHAADGRARGEVTLYKMFAPYLVWTQILDGTGELHFPSGRDRNIFYRFGEFGLIDLWSSCNMY